MNKLLLLSVLHLATALSASAISCGTFSVPLPCTLGLGQVQYTLSNFSILSATATGGASLISGGDLGISLVSGGGSAGNVEIRKVSTQDYPSTVFFANAGGFSGAIFSYDITISPLATGTVDFVSPTANRLLTSSALDNGSASVQMVLQGPNPLATDCQAVRTAGGLTQPPCSLPSGVLDRMTVSNILQVNGGTGNASLGQFVNQFNASFTPASNGNVPEPSAFLLLGGGLFALHRLRRRK